MTQTMRTIPTKSAVGEPVWEIAELFPEQGDWTEEGYLSLDTNRRVEFDNGVIEVLPMPKKIHQIIIAMLLKAIETYIERKKLGGIVLPAGYKVRIPNRKFREPDLLYLTAVQDAQSNEDFTEHAELVIEIVSPDDPNRDYIKKREEYALADVQEYWIVDRDRKQVIVLRLENGVYTQHGCFLPGQSTTSSIFGDLSISVDDALALDRA